MKTMENILKKLSVLAMCMIALTSCAQDNKTNENNNNAKNMNKGKSLVVYFSHAGENYSVGVIKEGNTKLVADEIVATTGADRFEIVAEKDYVMPYMQLIELAKKETENGELPPFKGGVEHIEQYDTVFIGGPIWWGTYPQVMFTFFKKYDLNGKTIIPFTTHEGSGLANVVEDVKKAYPNATVTNAFA